MKYRSLKHISMEKESMILQSGIPTRPVHANHHDLCSILTGTREQRSLLCLGRNKAQGIRCLSTIMCSLSRPLKVSYYHLPWELLAYPRVSVTEQKHIQIFTQKRCMREEALQICHPCHSKSWAVTCKESNMKEKKSLNSRHINSRTSHENT